MQVILDFQLSYCYIVMAHYHLCIFPVFEPFDRGSCVLICYTYVVSIDYSQNGLDVQN